MRPEAWPTPARLAAAASSGFLLTLAFPPVEQGWVALVAPVPLCLALRGRPRGRAGAAAGLVAGLAFFGVLLSWISLFGLLAWAVLVLSQAAWWALFGAFAARAGRGGAWARIVGWPLLWVGCEMARARSPLGGFAWGLLGSSQVDGGAVVHVARWGGVYLVGAVVLAVGALAAEALAAPWPRARAAAGAAAIALVLAPAAIPLGLAGARVGSLDVGAVQGNVPRGLFAGIGRGGGGAEDFVVVDNHVRVTERLEGDAPDLIVWPENSIDRDPRTNPDLFAPVADVVRRVGAPLLAGAILDAGDRFVNANILVSPDGSIGQRYDKVHLVPFGEYVPWRWARRVVPALDREIPLDGLPGRRLVVFDVGGARVGSVICFESTYPTLVRDLVRSGAQAIIVTTNNASFGTSPAARQHLAQSRMRALEHGRAVVHAAVAGISAIIAPDGSVVQRAGLFTPALLRASVPLTDGRTLYTRYGAALELAMGAGALAVAARALRRRPA